MSILQVFRNHFNNDQGTETGLNEDKNAFLFELERLNMLRESALTNDKHSVVLLITKEFVRHDIVLRTAIRDLTHEPAILTKLEEEILDFAIEMQSFVNYFKLMALSSIVDYLVTGYNLCISDLESDFGRGLGRYRTCWQVNDYYLAGITEMIRRANSRGEVEERVLEEIYAVFFEVKQNSFNTFRILSNQVLKEG